MDVLQSVTPSGSNSASDRITRDDFLAKLANLADKWKSHRKADLELRLETGKLLNQHYGEPTTPQARGKKVLKEAAERLGIDESELSRMRRFAFYFTSMEELKQKYPEVTTWTAVKELLPGLNSDKQSADGDAEPAKPAKAPSLASGMKQSLSKLSSKLREMRTNLTEAEKKDLLEKFQEFAKAVSDCLKIQITVNEAPRKKASKAPSRR
jgi:hypothetical protein